MIKAKELGYTDEIIQEIIQTHEEAKEKGIIMLYEDELENLPIANQ